MIRLYTCSGSISSRKTRAWLIANNIPFREINTEREHLKRAEIKKLLMICPNGTESIISKKSNKYKEIGSRFGDLKTNEVIELIQQCPSILKHPIIFDRTVVVTGFNEEKLRVFKRQGVEVCKQDDIEQ